MKVSADVVFLLIFLVFCEGSCVLCEDLCVLCEGFVVCRLILSESGTKHFDGIVWGLIQLM